MTFEAAVAWIGDQGRFGIKLGLDRMNALMDALGHPERGLRGALIAGTNGKGSTAAVLASILQADGMCTGLMPSPHLHSYTERIQTNLRPVTEAEFAQAVKRMQPVLAGMPPDLGTPTEFEILIGVAFDFLGRRVDRLVCEVGMGGRLDATNVLDLGLAVVTNVSLDHQQYLGSSVEAIAAEKAGIIKRGNHVLTGCDAPALAVVEQAAAKARAELWRLGNEIEFEGVSRAWDGSTLAVRGPGFEYHDLRLPLVGPFQVENAALAVAAAHVLGASPESVARGIADVRWPARVEVVSSAPRVVIDGAHNPAAIKRLVEAIQPLRGGEPLAIVFGVMEDHNPTAQLDELRQLEPQTLITTSANSPRAADPVQLADLWGSGALVVPIPAEALLAAKAQVGPSGMVLVCGSLYLAGEIYP